MAEGRFISPQFCDDVRQEVGNKFSLIGCYGPAMFVSAFPVVLPKLCVQVKAYTPIDRPFGKLVLRVLRDDQTLVELAIPAETLLAAAQSERPSGARLQMLNALMVMSPFPVEAPCELRVEAETEEATLTGGMFRIEPTPTGEGRQ